MRSIVLSTDSYKASHYLQFPPKTEYTYYYIESRGGTDTLLFFGLQAILKKLLCSPFPTKADVEKAERFWQAHGEPFNKKGWMDLVDLGYYPLKIKAIPEGSLAKPGEVLVTVENTDPRFFWLPGWIETRLLQVWYPTTVATKSFKCKQVINSFLEKTGTKELIDFKLHSFGYRGVSSEESAELGAMAELVNFKGTDTVAGIFAAQEYYNAEDMPGFSIPAAEHSTITTWGKEQETEAYRNMLKQFAKPDAMVSIVPDSYDYYNAIQNILGETLRQEVIDSKATVVIRPDSGSPWQVVANTLEILEAKFGARKNNKGFKVLNHVRVIQGDGIESEETIFEILNEATLRGFSADNIAFGMGGGSLQQVNRDTYKFAMKCSAAYINNQWRDVCKAPTGAPWKASKPGRVTNKNARTVFYNGKLKNEETFTTIRERACI